jgi:hypothetical protein
MLPAVTAIALVESTFMNTELVNSQHAVGQTTGHAVDRFGQRRAQIAADSSGAEAACL